MIIDGVTHTADVVIAADGSLLSSKSTLMPPTDLALFLAGVKSKAREIVLGYVDKPKPSGYAIFRAVRRDFRTLALISPS